MESEDKIEVLYLQFEVLSASGEGGEEAYLSIVSSAKGTHKEKILVAQFIPRFFHRFPNLSEVVMGAYLDLCEDENISVRKEAIKGFPKFFQGEKNVYTKRFGDTLCQMLASEEQSEANLVRDSLSALLKSSPESTLLGIFQQEGDPMAPVGADIVMCDLIKVKNGDEAVRGLVLKFLGNHIRKWNNIWNKDALETLLNQVKECLKDSLAEEIPNLVGLLLMTGLGKTLAGRRQILSAILSLLRKDDKRLPIFLRHATALISISPELSSNDFFLFLADLVPSWLPAKGDSLRVLKLFAELGTYTKDLHNVDRILDSLLSALFDFLPSPDTHLSVQTLNRLEFLTVECLLSTLQQVLKSSPKYFSRKAETLKDLRFRLLYYSKACSTYIQVIQKTVRNQTEEADKILSVARRTLSNIVALVKGFFHNPPIPATSITLSWLAVDRNSACKRKATNVDCDKNEKTQKLESDERQNTYKPPIGKYSQHL